MSLLLGTNQTVMYFDQEKLLKATKSRRTTTLKRKQRKRGNARSSQNQDRTNKLKASDATSKQTGLLAPEPKIPSNVLKMGITLNPHVLYESKT